MVTSNAKVGTGRIRPFERKHYFDWRKDDLVFKRGPALILNQNEHSLLAENFETALEQLEYSTKLLNLSETEETLKNSYYIKNFFYCYIKNAICNSFPEWHDEQLRQSLRSGDSSHRRRRSKTINWAKCDAWRRQSGPDRTLDKIFRRLQLSSIRQETESVHVHWSRGQGGCQ